MEPIRGETAMELVIRGSITNSVIRNGMWIHKMDQVGCRENREQAERVWFLSGGEESESRIRAGFSRGEIPRVFDVPCLTHNIVFYHGKWDAYVIRDRLETFPFP